MTAQREVRPTRLFVVADGDPRAASTNSGVAVGLLTALESLHDVEVVGSVSTRPGPVLRLLVIASSIRPSLDRWRNASRKGRVATYVRSRIRDRAVRNVDEDVIILHIRNTYLPPSTPHRYVAFIDATGHQNQLGWDDWRLSPKDYSRRTDTERAYFTGALAVVTATSSAADSVVKDYQVPSERVTVVGGGLNELVTGVTVPRPPRPRCRNVLFVGKDFDRKGGPYVLDAFTLAREQVPDLELRIVGPPGLSIDRGGVTVVGAIDASEMAAEYEWGDVFCMPSRHEPYGLAIQEALAAGLPCIVSSVGVLPTLIDHGRMGTVVPVSSVKGVADALVAYATDDRLWSEVTEQVLASSPPSWTDVASKIVAAVAG